MYRFISKRYLWLTQKTMAELFGVERLVITKHLKNIFQTAEDGKSYNTSFYRLEAILAVGYRVNSVQATELRK